MKLSMVCLLSDSGAEPAQDVLIIFKSCCSLANQWRAEPKPERNAAHLSQAACD